MHKWDMLTYQSLSLIFTYTHTFYLIHQLVVASSHRGRQARYYCVMYELL